MNRVVVNACFVACVTSIFVIVARQARSGQPEAIVRLQQSTPGVQQIGNLSISGTGRASVLQAENSSAVSGAYAVYGLANAASGTTYGVLGQSASTSGRGVYGEALAGTGANSGVWGRTASTSGRGVYGLANTATGSNFGGYFESNSTDGRGVFGLATATSGFAYGGEFRTSSTNGRGVFGYATATTGNTYGGNFSVDSTSGIAVRGDANATSGTTYGGYFFNGSTSGTGVYGLANAASGTTYGVLGQSASTSGRGVYGEALAGTGANSGVWGRTASTSGRGVYGLANTATGSNFGGYFESNSTDGRGVFGLATAVSGSNYGVYGQCDNTSTGYAVWGQGRMSATIKLFRIDHPFDPENKYLLHYCAEGPEPLNVYCGNVTTDGKGEAWIQLPSYFDEINRDFRYTLTVVDDNDTDDFIMVKIARKIVANRFKIRTSRPNVDVSWEVKGVRNDRWVRKYGAPVEVAKEGVEKGKYQHPELYGLGPERGMNFDPQLTQLSGRR